MGLGLFGEPYLLIRTTSVVEREFGSVEEAFGRAEGDSSIQKWTSSRIKTWKGKQGHDGIAFGFGIGKTVLCDKFEVIWPTLEEEFP